MSEYIFVIDNKGIRQTSYIIGVHGKSYGDIYQLAKQQHPQYELVQGDDEMQRQFTQDKAYINGKFVNIPVEVQEKTKVEKIAEIKAYYDKRFETLEQMVLRRRLNNGDISDLQEQYKKLNAEMLTKIKAVK